MALRPVFSREADQDVNDIVDYISVDNPAAAEAILRRLEKSTTLLCSRPNMGMLALATRPKRHAKAVGSSLHPVLFIARP